MMLKISTYKNLPSFFLCVVFEHRIINSTYVSLPELFVGRAFPLLNTLFITEIIQLLKTNKQAILSDLQPPFLFKTHAMKFPVKDCA